MDSGLTPAAAQELGRTYRFVRQAREMTLREASKASGMSMQYVMNIEQGSRTNVSEPFLRKLGAGYRLAPTSVDNLLLRARIVSALERRGLDAAQQMVAWRRTEAALAELGIDTQEGVREMVAALYG